MTGLNIQINGWDHWENDNDKIKLK